VFGELAALHGDKGVWKLLHRHAGEVADVETQGPIPLDVDTWEDYRRVLLAAAVD
jgi:molybdenum cofactor cytidylyltransferase